jgi:hypothetical protein
LLRKFGGDNPPDAITEEIWQAAKNNTHYTSLTTTEAEICVGLSAEEAQIVSLFVVSCCHAVLFARLSTTNSTAPTPPLSCQVANEHNKGIKVFMEYDTAYRRARAAFESQQYNLEEQAL